MTVSDERLATELAQIEHSARPDKRFYAECMRELLALRAASRSQQGASEARATPDELEALVSGANHIRGYYAGRPMSEITLDRLMRHEATLRSLRLRLSGGNT